jgi:hypothetical protein
MAWQFLGSNTLIWQPDTRVQTFPSGLVLVQRSAICRNTYLTTARGSITVGAALPCESPSTVTVFQFPQAQEIHEGNGFVRFDVSGYGKWSEGIYRERDVFRGNTVVPAFYRNFVTTNTINFNFSTLLPTISPTTLPFIMNGVITGTCTVSGFWLINRAELLGEYGAYAEVEIDAIFRLTTSNCSYF